MRVILCKSQIFVLDFSIISAYFLLKSSLVKTPNKFYILAFNSFWDLWGLVQSIKYIGEAICSGLIELAEQLRYQGRLNTYTALSTTIHLFFQMILVALILLVA